MSWNAFHNRGETLRAVVDTVNTRCDGELPMDLPGVTEHFADDLDLVGALLLKWHARLSGNVERAMAREPLDLQAAVASAWRTTAEQMPGVRLVIDRCVEQPSSAEMERAMIRAREREWARLAAAAGLASGQGAAASAAGRRVVEQARDGLDELAMAVAQVAVESVPAEPVGAEPVAAGPARRAAPSESFVDRIRAVLAAA